MRLTKKIISALLTVVMLLTFCTVGIFAAPADADELTVTPDADAKSVVVEINLPDLANKDVSLICLDPSYTYDGSNISDWARHADSVVEMRQVTLDGNGKATVTLKFKEIVEEGDYTISVGAGDRTYEKQATFAQPSPVVVTADKEEYAVDETITLTVKTPVEINKLRVYNEGGKRIALTGEEVAVDGDVKTWTLTTSLGSAGDGRSLTVKALGIFNELIAEGSVVFDVKPVISIDSASANVAAATTGENFRVTVATRGVKSVKFVNETGRAIGKTKVSVTAAGSVTTWVYDMNLASTLPGGTRTITVVATGVDGSEIESSFDIVIVQAA